MSFDWSDYLQLATVLGNNTLQGVTDEARLRCAVSRVYYAVYWSARSCVEAADGALSRDEGSHQRIISRFWASKAPDCHRIAQDLERLRLLRVQADYQAHKPVTTKTFYDATLYAETSLLLIEKVQQKSLL